MGIETSIDFRSRVNDFSRRVGSNDAFVDFSHASSAVYDLGFHGKSAQGTIPWEFHVSGRVAGAFESGRQAASSSAEAADAETNVRQIPGGPRYAVPQTGHARNFDAVASTVASRVRRDFNPNREMIRRRNWDAVKDLAGEDGDLARQEFYEWAATVNRGRFVATRNQGDQGDQKNTTTADIAAVCDEGMTFFNSLIFNDDVFLNGMEIWRSRRLEAHVARQSRFGNELYGVSGSELEASEENILLARRASVLRLQQIYKDNNIVFGGEPEGEWRRRCRLPIATVGDHGTYGLAFRIGHASNSEFLNMIAIILTIATLLPDRIIGDIRNSNEVGPDYKNSFLSDFPGQNSDYLADGLTIPMLACVFGQNLIKELHFLFAHFLIIKVLSTEWRLVRQLPYGRPFGNQLYQHPDITSHPEGEGYFQEQWNREKRKALSEYIGWFKRIKDSQRNWADTIFLIASSTGRILRLIVKYPGNAPLAYLGRRISAPMR